MWLKNKKILTLKGLVLPVLGLVACSSADFVGITEDFSTIRVAHLYAPDQATMDIGQDILSLGGNAIDATIAMGIASGVLHPQRTSLLAGGICLGYEGESKTPFELDFSSDIYSGYSGFPALHAKFSRLPWSALVAPAYRLALQDETAQNVQESLFVWMNYPFDFANRDPYAEHPLDYRWEIKPSFTQPLGMVFQQNILTVSDSFGQREFVTGGEVSQTDVKLNPVNLVGGLDRAGNGILCAQSLDEKPLSTDPDLGMSIPVRDYNHFPQLVLAYGQGNSLLRWVAAFDRNISAERIRENFVELLSENSHLLTEKDGYLMSYCPVGLPFKSVNQSVNCVSDSSENRSLGWVTRN